MGRDALGQFAPVLMVEDEELGLQKHCPRCDDWWPADAEFFYSHKRRGRVELDTWCRACWQEYRAEYKKRTP
jgi:hypothetical protein